MHRPTCQVVLEGPSLCGDTAPFMYTGGIPEGMSQKEIERKSLPHRLFMCVDHATAIRADLAWPMRDGDCSLTRSDRMIIHRFHCTTCHAFTKVIWDTDAPGMNPGQLQFCPRCGAATNAHMDADEDYWDVLAAAFDNMPVDLVKMLYQEWDRTKYQRFGSYVHAAMQEFDSTGEVSLP